MFLGKLVSYRCFNGIGDCVFVESCAVATNDVGDVQEIPVPPDDVQRGKLLSTETDVEEFGHEGEVVLPESMH